MAAAAVVTADIVNSTKLSKADLRKIIKSLETIFASYKYEFFRGDSFQVYFRSPSDSLRAMLLARAAAIKLSSGVSDIKASIGIDQVHVPVRNLKTASGGAFVLSGRYFDAMRPQRRLVIACPAKNELANIALRVMGTFIDYIFSRMTPKQAAVVFEILLKKSQVETAKKLKKSQATIHKHMQSAGWPELENMLSEYDLLTKSIKA
jgi:hypothetical protein